MPFETQSQTLIPNGLPPVLMQVPSPGMVSLFVLPRRPACAERSTATFAKIC